MACHDGPDDGEDSLILLPVRRGSHVPVSARDHGLGHAGGDRSLLLRDGVGAAGARVKSVEGPYRDARGKAAGSLGA